MNFNYRYPGSSPFEDNEYDRLLFFGREREKQALFHLVMSERLSVLFAKSGIGKTSLIHAGLNQMFREKGFIPLVIRFHADYTDPFQAIYKTIEDITKRHLTEYKSGKQDSLWEYFKTVQFWTADDVLLSPLSPVVILDQFEEFFAVYSPEKRKEFIRQLADLVRNRIPAKLFQAETAFPYSETPPDVKILIAVREDYLGLLEEMADDIPHIFQNRFRLMPLTREQAKEAIINPAALKDERIQTSSFKYEDDALDAILDFLCKRRGWDCIKIINEYGDNALEAILKYLSNRKEQDGIKFVNEIESFQLQLICSHIENKISEKSDTQNDLVIAKQDLSGLPDVLQKFYEDQLNMLEKKDKKNVLRLCEEGLISVSDRRLSLEQEEIERKFKVSKPVLERLINSRLLRAECRVGSVYYELIHCILIESVRNFQKERKKRQRKEKYPILILSIFLFPVLFFGYCHQKSVNDRIGKLKSEAQYFLTVEKKPEEAIKKYEEAIKITPENAYLYSDLGYAFYTLKRYNEAIKMFDIGIALDPKAETYTLLGNVHRQLEEYNKAIETYNKAITLDPKFAKAYYNLGLTYHKLKRYRDAVAEFNKAIKFNPKFAIAYNHLGYMLYILKQYEEAITAYHKAIELNPKIAFAKENLAEILICKGDTGKALSISEDRIKERNISPDMMLANQFNIICALLIENRRTEAFEKLKNLIQYHQKTLSQDDVREWLYETMKKIISEHRTLPETDKRLLLKLADALESPKPEADRKMKEIEAGIK